MRSRMLTGLTIAGGVFAAVAAAPAGAATPIAADLLAPGKGLAPLVRAAKTPLVAKDLRLARRVARVEGERLKPGYTRTVRRWSLTKLTRHHRHLHRELRSARRARAEARAAARAEARAAAASTASPALEAIAACESGGNPQTDTGNGFYGKYQFTLATWQAVGGSGNPAQASEAEQDRRAATLLAQAGPGQWPVCGQ
jgi:Transglycosylase-like domain